MNPSEIPERATTRKPKLRDSKEDISGDNMPTTALIEPTSHSTDSKPSLASLFQIIKDLEQTIDTSNMDEQEKDPFIQTLQKLSTYQTRQERERFEKENMNALMEDVKEQLRQALESVQYEREKGAQQMQEIMVLTQRLESVRDSESDDEHSHSSGPVNLTLPFGQEDILSAMTSKNEALQLEVVHLQSQIKDFRYETDDLQEKLNLMIAEKNNSDMETHAVKDMLASKKSELEREVRNRERLEQALTLQQDSFSKKDNEIQTKTYENQILKEKIAKSELHLKEESLKVEKMAQEIDGLLSKYTRAQQDYEEQVLTVSRLMSENQKQHVEVKGLVEESQRMHEEIRALQRTKDNLNRKVKATDELKLDTEMERDKLKGNVQNLMKELEDSRKEIESTKKQVDLMSRDRDIAQKNFVKASGATQKQAVLVKTADHSRKELETEIFGYKEEASKMRKLIFSLEKERERLMMDNNHFGEQMKEMEEEIKSLSMSLFGSGKKITDLGRKLKEQQQMYEAVRAERNLYSKNLGDSQDEVSDFRKKIKMMSHQIEQLKEEIASKNEESTKQVFEYSKLEKEKLVQTKQMSLIQQQVDDLTHQLSLKHAQETTLRRLIESANLAHTTSVQEHAVTTRERDILCVQLIRKSQESALLHEKIKIQSSTMRQGNFQYLQRVQDIKCLKLEIKRLMREKSVLQTETAHNAKFRHEIIGLQKQSLKERAKVKSLEDELETPLNIHRWRKLAGSDPTTFDLVKKVQMLQRRLIQKTEDVVEKELLILQKEKMMDELKKCMTRQPGVEVVEELRASKETVKQKLKECKSLASELNMYHTQIQQYKTEIEKLQREQQETKKAYFTQKRKDQKKMMQGNTITKMNHGYMDKLHTFGNNHVFEKLPILGNSSYPGASVARPQSTI